MFTCASRTTLPARLMRAAVALTFLVIAILALAPARVLAQEDDVMESIPFSSERWMPAAGGVSEHLGREAFAGFAYLGDVELENGVVEVDIAMAARRRSYPGIVLRMGAGGDYESFYIRPHRSPLYPDALQYTPVFKNVSSWQLYSGDGFTALYDVTPDEWVTVRVEFSGSQARVFLNDDAEPALVIPELQHEPGPGFIGVKGPTDGTAYFSEFRFREADDLGFEPAPLRAEAPGLLTEWEISQAFKMSAIDLETHYAEQELGELVWQDVTALPSGLVDVARIVPRTPGGPDCIVARTTVVAEEARTLALAIGYSDLVSVFINGTPAFLANSAYTSRDPSFLGILGLSDVVYLPLRAGENEVSLLLAESFGGWGFLCRDREAVFEADGVGERWEVGGSLLTPEAVVFDAGREILYVSNYDSYRASDATGGQAVATVSLDGELLDPRWVVGLKQPTGMFLRGDHLYVVERGGLVEIDVTSGQVSARYPLAESSFLNDVTGGPSGPLYLSDTEGSVIYRFLNGSFERWVEGDAVGRPNSLEMDGDRVLAGCTATRRLKAIDVETGEVTTVAEFPEGIFDGIARVGGDLLVSHWEGRLYRVSQGGRTEKLLDTTGVGVQLADFEYVESERAVFIPTFNDGRVVSYSIGE